MSTPAPATRVAELNSKIRATRKPTGQVTVGCPVCGCEDAHDVDVTITRGRHASRMGSSECDEFDFEAPSTCGECKCTYSAEQMLGVERTIEETAADHYGRSYTKTYTGEI